MSTFLVEQDFLGFVADNTLRMDRTVRGLDTHLPSVGRMPRSNSGVVGGSYLHGLGSLQTLQCRTTECLWTRVTEQLE